MGGGGEGREREIGWMGYEGRGGNDEEFYDSPLRKPPQHRGLQISPLTTPNQITHKRSDIHLPKFFSFFKPSKLSRPHHESPPPLIKSHMLT